MGGIYSILEHLQSEDDASKLLFNNVKNVTKSYQDSREPEGQSVKIANGFKNMVSKIIREFLQSLQYKVDVYLAGASNQVKYTDIRKIIRIASSLDSIEELKSQFDTFEQSVKHRVEEIETQRLASKSKPVDAKPEQPEQPTH